MLFDPFGSLLHEVVCLILALPHLLIRRLYLTLSRQHTEPLSFSGLLQDSLLGSDIGVGPAVLEPVEIVLIITHVDGVIFLLGPSSHRTPRHLLPTPSAEVFNLEAHLPILLLQGPQLLPEFFIVCLELL